MLQPNAEQALQNFAQRTFAEKNVLKVTENIYYFSGYGHSNATLIMGNHSCILVDALDSDITGQALRQEIDNLTDKPVKTIIYTHRHPDHRGGSGAFVDTVEEILAFSPRRHMFKHNDLLQDIFGLRTHRQFGYGLCDKELITQGLGPREAVTNGTGKYVILPPTTLYTTQDVVEREIDGVTLKLVSAVGETDDQIFVWLPESKTMCCGDNYYPCWPNLYAIRGGQYRDVEAWIDSLDAIRAYPINTLLPGHGYALHRNETVQTVLKNYRDAIEYVLLQTLTGMNMGKTADELAESIKLPEHLRQLPYLGEYYGTVAWSVRGIYGGYMGWFDGDPANLNPLPEQELRKNQLRMMGGEPSVLAEIQRALEERDAQWAMELCNLLLKSGSKDTQKARKYKAQACLLLSEQETSANGRHYYQCYAKELMSL